VNASPACELAHLDGSYVLGAVSPEERLDFERHLPGCPACARAVQQLAGLPGLLAQVSADVLESRRVEEPVPDTLLPALVREVRVSRERRRWVAALAAAAAVLVLGGGTALVVHAVDNEAPPAVTSTARDMTPLGQDSVVADLALTSVAWGTRLELVCSYDEPGHAYEGEDGATYSLVVRSRDGDVEQVASWKALPGRTMSLSGATALTVDDIAAVEVRTAEGHPILVLSGRAAG
jgi:hypothetical protein